MFQQPRRFDRSTALFVSLFVISFLLATFDVRASGGGFGGSLRDGVQAVFTPVQRAADAVTRPIVGFIDGLSNLATLRDENETLAAEVEELRRQLDEQEIEALVSRLEELEKINDLDPPGEYATITARVFAADPSDFAHIRTISKGSRDGVLVGMPVIDENGLAGRVVRVGDDWARVRLITDPLMAVSVRVDRSRDTGLVTGRGSGDLSLEIFAATDRVLSGDRLVTDGSRYPTGIPVAIVTEDARAEAGFVLQAGATPLVEFSNLDFVKVIVFTPLTEDTEETEEPSLPEFDEGDL